MDKDLENTLQTAEKENEEQKTRRFRGSALITEEGYVTFTPQGVGEKRVEKLTVLPCGAYMLKTLGREPKIKTSLVAPMKGNIAESLYAQLDMLLDTLPDARRKSTSKKTLFRNEEMKITIDTEGNYETSFSFQRGTNWTKTMSKLMALVNKASQVLFKKQQN